MAEKNPALQHSISIRKKSLTLNSVFLAVASGVLLFLSFPKFGSGYLAWFSLVPLFWALKDVVILRNGLILGFITGLVCNIGLVYWIVYVVVNYGYLPVYLGIIIMLLLAIYLSLYTAVFAAGIVFFQRKIALYLFAPALWICLEYCKSYLITGFPWENLGYSQYLNKYIIQSADIYGVFGISLVVVLVNTTFFEIIFNKSKGKYVLLGLTVFIVAAVVSYGIIRSANIDKALEATPDKEIALIQGNIDQSIKWNEKFQKDTVNIYEELSLKNAPSAGGIIIWPETALPFNYQDINSLQKQVTDIALRTENWFIFGSTSYEKSGDNTDYFNSAYILSPEGKTLSKYDKVHLVPYGEYVPLRNVFPFIKKLTAGMGDFSSGKGYFPLKVDSNKIGILICYEGILSDAARMYKNKGAELLVNITNDAWFGATSAPFQHFSMTVLRAVETRLYFVRAANTGISAVITPNGEIISQTDIFKKSALKGNIKYSQIKSIYARFGDILVFMCFIFLLAFLIFIINERGIFNGGRKRSGNDK